MKKKLFGAVALAAIALGIFYFRDSYSSHNNPSLPSPSNNLVIRSGPRWEKPKINRSTNEWERFQVAILPIATDFLKCFESLRSNGVVLPVKVPITTNMLTNLRFAGGPSNTTCSFTVGGHTRFLAYIVKREGKEYRGVDGLVRGGRDEEGIPRDCFSFKQNPVANEPYMQLLADTNRYPARNLQEVAMIAQRALFALHPEDAAMYPLNESWQEQWQSTVLPFYLFTFTRKGPPGTDPANLWRDEMEIGFKSTKEGLVLDFFEDTSLAFTIERLKTK